MLNPLGPRRIVDTARSGQFAMEVIRQFRALSIVNPFHEFPKEAGDSKILEIAKPANREILTEPAPLMPMKHGSKDERLITSSVLHEECTRIPKSKHDLLSEGATD